MINVELIKGLEEIEQEEESCSSSRSTILVVLLLLVDSTTTTTVTRNSMKSYLVPKIDPKWVVLIRDFTLLLL